MNVVDRLRAQAEARPEAAALVEGRGAARRVTTFADLDAAGAQRAAQLRAAGLQPGDAVLVLIPLSARLYEVLAAVFRAGLVAVVLDPSAGREHVEASCRLRPPDAFVGSPKAHLLRALVPGVRRIPRRFVVGGWAPFASRWGRGEDRLGVEPVGRDAPALLTFTSGTTGQPKAAVRSHGLLVAQHAAIAEALELAPGQIDLATLPVVVLANLASGVTTVLPDADLRRVSAFNVAPVLDQIRAERPTRSVASPAFFERLLDHAAPGDLASFERFDSGGAPVHADLLDCLAATGAEAVGVYGSTEAEPIAHLGAADLTEADRERITAGGGLPVGRPVPHVDLRVITDRWGEALGPFPEADWDALRLGAGEVGEIVVTGDHVVPGYLGGQGDAETKVEVDGRRWHRTGDAGRLDADGRLWLLGRCAAASVRDGEAVYPLQVEAALRARGMRAAFLELDGRRLVAVEGGADPEAVRAGVAWAGIDDIVPVDAIPVDRRHNAKVDLAALRTLLATRRG